jgi:hypothetical protein
MTLDSEGLGECAMGRETLLGRLKNRPSAH